MHAVLGVASRLKNERMKAGVFAFAAKRWGIEVEDCSCKRGKVSTLFRGATILCFFAASLASNCVFAGQSMARTALSQTCPVEGPAVELVTSKDEQGRSIVRLEESRIGHVVWEGDLNDDGRLDKIVFEEDTCGKGAYCNFRVYAGCMKGNQHVLVLGPEYAQELKVASDGLIVEGRRWRDVVSVEQTKIGTQNQVFSFYGKIYEISLAHLYKESMKLYKNKDLARAFSSLDWYFRSRDFKDLSRIHVSTEQYAQILNDYAFMMQLNYERKVKSICKKTGRAYDSGQTSEKQLRDEMFTIRAGLLPRAMEILDFVIQLQTNRSVAYLNRADLLFELDMDEAAAENYRKYLELMKDKSHGMLPRRASDPSARAKQYKCE